MLSAAFLVLYKLRDIAGIQKNMDFEQKRIKYEFLPYLWYNGSNKKGEVFYAN